jgi:hypothetical protein
VSPSPLDIVSLYAKLVDEPFNLSMNEIADLTDFQIAEIYFHARDKEGGIKQQVEASGMNPKEAFFAIGRGLKVPQKTLEAQWEKRHGKKT